VRILSCDVQVGSRLVRVYAAQEGVHDVRDDTDQGARRAAQRPPRQLAVIRVHHAHLPGSDTAFSMDTGTGRIELQTRVELVRSVSVRGSHSTRCRPYSGRNSERPVAA